MTENELYELNSLPEIDPNYEKKIELAQDKAEKLKFRTLFLPVLSILASVFLIVLFLTRDCIPLFITALGLTVGGIVPTVLIVRNKPDTSKYFPVKIISFAVTAAGAVFVFLGNAVGLVLLGAAIIGELAFALPQKTDRRTKLCLILSSWVWGVIGFLLDTILSFWWKLG